MVSNHYNVAKLVQSGILRNKMKTTFIFCTVVACLSMPILPGSYYARSQGASGGGALGSLLNQLKNLEGTGALDTLEGGKILSPLNDARGARATKIRELIKNNNEKSKKEREEREPWLRKKQQLLLAQNFCSGRLHPKERETFEIVGRISPLEKDYCQRVGEILFQYGYDLFDEGAILQNLDTGSIFPEYILGIDDEFVITFRGRLDKSFTVSVDREGRLILPNFKPILAAGHTFGEVRREIAARTAATHLGTEVFVSLASVRLVNILVLGEVHEPGRKQLTALNTLTDAIRLGGGIKKTGSIRRIHVQRGDQVFWMDAYDLLFSGITARDMSLRDGDRVIVPPLGPTYALAGDVKRPGIYEMPDGQRHLSLAEALKMSGGTIRPRGNIFHQLGFRKTGHQELREHKNLAAKVQDGDIIHVSRSQNIQIGGVTIDGHVHVPGRRALNAAPSVSALLGDSRSLQSNPYLLFAALETTDPRTRARRLFPLNLSNILHGKEDYALRENDRLLVLGANDVNYLSSASVQNVVGLRIDSDSNQEIFKEDADDVKRDTRNRSLNESNSLLAIRKLLASSRGTALTEGDKNNTNSSENAVNKTENNLANLDFDFQQTCAGLRQLRAIVSANSANRFANAIRTLNTANLARTNRQDCPKIFDQFGGLLPLALEHTVAINGEVRRPGAYPIVGDVSLTDLISVAGGLSREVDLTRVEISRFTPNSAEGSGDTARGLVNLAEVDADKVTVGPGDVVRFNSVATDRDTGPVLLIGEFVRPGLYEIRRGERLSDVITRAGGLTPQAYPYGGIFTRKRVRAEQSASLLRAKRELTSALAVVAVQRNVNPQTILALQGLANQLDSVESIGRIVTETDPTVLLVRPELDSVLEPGDRLYMPKRPNFVTVVGDVLNPGAQQFIAGTTADEYIQQAGGFQRSADEDRVFVVYPNGRAEQLAINIWNYKAVQLPPGSSLVVPKDPAPLDIFTLVREGSSLIGELAVTAASLAVISRD